MNEVTCKLSVYKVAKSGLSPYKKVSFDLVETREFPTTEAALAYSSQIDLENYELWLDDFKVNERKKGHGRFLFIKRFDRETCLRV